MQVFRMALGALIELDDVVVGIPHEDAAGPARIVVGPTGDLDGGGHRQRSHARCYRAGYELAAIESGTYLVVYGPAYSWSADYHIEINCADCRLPGQCLDDSECASGEYCGDNGVRCIVAPCLANYDVCQALEPDGAWCDRDEMCEGFCGWDDNNDRVCKPWAQEGEGCGGFVLPAFRRFCELGLSCECTETTCDAPGICTAP